MRDVLERIERHGATATVDELSSWLGHDDWHVRRAAVEAAVALLLDPERRAEALEALVEALYSEENAGLRNAAQSALRRVASRIAPRLAREIEQAPVDVQILIAPVLGESGDADAIALLADLARSDDVNVATSAIAGLGRSSSRDAVAPLLDALRRGHPWLVFPAVEALGALGDARAVAPVAARIDDPLVAPVAREALVQIGGPAALTLAARIFDGGVRAADLDALVRIGRARLPRALARVERSAAVAAFRAVYAPHDFDALDALARGESPYVESAIEALGWTRDERALALLLSALASPATHAAAVAGLAALFEDTTLAARARDLASRLPAGARLDLTRALHAIAPVDAALLLPELLSDADEEIWREATALADEVSDRLAEAEPNDAAREAFERIAAVMDLYEPEALTAATSLLGHLAIVGELDDDALDAHAARLVTHPDVDARLAGTELQAIVGRLTPEARHALDEALHSPDAFARLRAVEIAAVSGLPELRGLFETARGDDEPLVRRCAVAALSRFEDDEARRAIERAVADEDDLVAADAVDALARRGDDEAVFEASRSDRALLRCVAADRLGELRSEGALERLAAMAADDADFEVRRAALAALAGTAIEAGAIARGLADEHHAVRHAALKLAAERCDAAHVEAVESLADRDESIDVRGEALVALAGCAPDAALDRVGHALLDARIAPYALRALELVGERDAGRLRRYRDEAPPRAARAADVLLAERG